MSIYKFRVVIDTEEDVFRDIEINTDDNFRSFHEAILSAFDFEEGEMASFYMSNDQWERGTEITLMDMEMPEEDKEMAQSGIKAMSTTLLHDFVREPDDKIIYVYDFLRMWCFYIELVEARKARPSTIYPRVALKYGESPDQLSKEVDLFDDLLEEPQKTELTGDPEIDAYLEEDEMGGDEFGSIDDLGEEYL